MPRLRAGRAAPIIESSDSEDEVSIPKKPKIVSKPKTTTGDSSSSESDIEKYLLPVNKIDLKSSFFDPGVKTISSEKPDLTTSEEDEPICEAVAGPSTTTDFTIVKQFEDYTKKIEETKKKIEEYEKKRSTFDDVNLNINVDDILAECEAKGGVVAERSYNSSDYESVTDEDENWEEVDEKAERSVIPSAPVEIRVDMPENIRKKKGKDLLACLKRRLNRIRKENQIYVHKVHLLCWISHGFHVNRTVNDPLVLGAAMSLLPNGKCAPDGRTDLDYLEQILQWYRKTVILVEKKGEEPRIEPEAIRTQMEIKKALSYRMFVFIFAAILRALGIQCRIVFSFRVEPLRPPANELHSLAAEKVKKEETGKISDKVEKKKVMKGSLKEEIKKEKSKLGSTSKTKIENKEKVKTNQRNVTSAKNSLRSNGNKKNAKCSEEIKAEKSKIVKNEKREGGLKRKESGTNLKKTDEEKLNKNSNNAKSEVTKRRGRSAVRDLKVEENKNKNDEDKKIPENKGKNLKEKLVKAETSTKSLEKREIRARTKNNKNEIEKIPKPPDKVVKSGKLKDKLNAAKKSTGFINKRTTRSKKSKEDIPQVDGPHDTPPKTPKPNKKRINFSKLRSSTSQDSEDDFRPSPASRRSLNVKSDIINLIKGRIAEQKYIDRSKLVKKRKPPVVDDDSSDSDYAPEPIKKKYHSSDSDLDDFVPKTKVKRPIKVKKTEQGMKIVSSDDETKKQKTGRDVWIEVFVEAEETWIAVDVVQGKVHCINEIYKRATHPVTYVVAFNNYNTVKDVTMRYCKNFSTITRKLRVDPKWWEDTLLPFRDPLTAQDKEEDDDLNRQQLDQPMPKSISEYKNHPLYALGRHLLKFEAIYPPDAIPLGYIGAKKEPVYPRNCVYVCKSRDIWLKDARVVKPGEKPYKIVKARPKYDKMSNKIITDQLLEIFGPWQTMDYEPPTAENGVVPRNAFGNVELFKPCMLPKKTVHLKLPGLNKICKKMNIDCASAIVGFDFHGGWSHPVYDGFVVCEEFADKLIVAWELEQDEIERKEQEKINARVYGNWKKLIKGLLIRERIKMKYSVETTTTEVEKKKSKKK